MGDENETEGHLIMHVRGNGYIPMEANPTKAVEFETDGFVGRCLFLHRPGSSFDNAETGENYPYKQHFHGRKRLWEWRVQGRFKRRPKVLYVGIELEEYVAVTWATRALMKGMLPLIQRALQCKLVHHEIGNEHDALLRPEVVAPIWAVDSTLIHNHPSEAPALDSTTLPTGLSRKAARQYWEAVWNGGQWEETHGGPTYTFVVWGPSPLMDLQAWVFRKLPLTWGRNLSMEPFCGRQPVHAVIYELEGENKEHRQENKNYMWDVRFMPEPIWTALAMGDISPQSARLAAEKSGIEAPAYDDDMMSRTESFCSALSHDGSDDDDQLLETGQLIPDMEELLRSSTGDLPRPLVRSSNDRRVGAGFIARILGFRISDCCKRRRRRWSLLPT